MAVNTPVIENNWFNKGSKKFSIMTSVFPTILKTL